MTDPIALPKRAEYESGTVPIALSGWVQAAPATKWASLGQDLDTDVVVIGAGIAGAAVALHLAERQCDVVVLEAAQPAGAASGRNAGHVTPIVGMFKPLKQWPGEGRAFLDLLVSNKHIVFDLVRRYDLQVDCANTGMLETVDRFPGMLAQKERHWRQLGYEVETVGREQLLALLGTDKYRTGLRWREGGKVNPYEFTNGLIDAAHRLGASVFGDSRVTGCEREGDRWRVRTDSGSVLAKKVVLCTSGHTGNAFFPHLASTQYPLVAYAMATKPLPTELLQVVNPSGAAFKQAPLGLYPLVLDGLGRLVTAGIPGRFRAADAERYFRSFLRFLHRTWPQTKDVRIEMSTYWTGMTACSSPVVRADYPKFYRVDDGVYGFMNLGTWGNMLGPLLGMNLAQTLIEDRPDKLVVPLETPAPVRFRRRLEFKVRDCLIPMARMAEATRLLA